MSLGALAGAWNVRIQNLEVGSGMSVIDEIKERVDIVEVVSEYVPGLKKAGRSYRALCPFHSEKTPSFFVFPERQSWHCFGACGTGGDVFSFVMKKENIDFGEALRLLARRAGVTLAEQREGADDKEREEIYRANEIAAEYYHHLLLNSSAAGGARDYLAQRGISTRSIEDFQLGFSLVSWDALYQHLKSRNSLEQGLAAGLLVERDDGGNYDRFRNHLMFPIRNLQGRTVGFGARVLDDSIPKYLNSPQTAVFDKSGVLYGIDRARSAIRRQKSVVIVEGYMDVIIAHQHGFDNVVASMGTSLTGKQVGILRKLTRSFTLALDADEAGKMATRRGLESVWHATEGIGRLIGGRDRVDEIKIVSMPAGKDPDDVIRDSPERWRNLVDAAPSWVDFVFDMVASDVDVNNARSRVQAADQMLPFISAMPDPIEQAHYLQKLAHLVGVDERTLAAAMKRLRGSGSKSPEAGMGEPPLSIEALPMHDPREEYCLLLLFHYPELKGKGEGIPVDCFSHTENRELFLAWRNAPAVELIGETLEMPLREHFNYLMARELPPMSDAERERALADCIRHLRERWLRDLKTKEAILLSDADTSRDTAEVEELERMGLSRNIQLREIFLEAERRNIVE